MTDQQATALVELAACPNHRREDRYQVSPPEWDMPASSVAVSHNGRYIDHYATREMAQAYVDYMNANH